MCVFSTTLYINVPFDIILGSAWGDGGGAGCPVTGRASHSDDTQHLPLRWCVRQECHSRRTQAQGDHQRLQETKDTLSHHLPERTGCQGCREVQGERERKEREGGGGREGEKE